MSISVCIFACNEEQTLPTCVGALDAAGLSETDQVHILVNGCTDNTAFVARALAQADTRISVHELPVGDKANAWNEYMHRLADPALSMHVFIDGDVWMSADAITELGAALEDAPDAYAAAALPASGRSRRGWASRLLQNHYLSGNLYALSHDCLNSIRDKSIRLPYGAKGEDGLITYLLLTDFRGGEDDSHRRMITIADKATFEFHSLGPSWRDWKTYRKRLFRYSMRHFQKQVLYRRLKTYGVSAMPETIDEIYTPETVRKLRPRFDLVNFWFDCMTLRRLTAFSSPKNAASSVSSISRPV